MNVKFVKWKNWDAVQCSAGKADLIIGISAGPRILSFTYDSGENILYEDYTGFNVGEWRIYGGHRFTIAPENDDSYYPDNDQCEVIIGDTALHISAKQRLNGLLLSLVISELPEGCFTIDHVLLNNGSTSWQGALWAITCVPRSDVLIASCQAKKIHFWPGTDASKWKQVDGNVYVENGNFRGKAGWYNAAPDFKAINQQGEFQVSSADTAVPERCVDNGCNAEMFVCGDWAELETLSENFLVEPGGSVSHKQQWRFNAL